MDLLFDEDTAFWPALAQVSQKAKCPIVLTASSVPKELRNFQFQEISLDRPPAGDCSLVMMRVASSEGMRFRDDIFPEERDRRLQLIAEACQSDLRKILNEMQLFHLAWQHPGGGSDNGFASINMDDFGLLPKNGECFNPCNEIAVAGDRPLILSVKPMLVSRDRHTLIVITGKNFSEVHSNAMEPTNLLLGGQQCCHFRVVSDDKIVAVCAPCVLTNVVLDDVSHTFDDTDYLTCKFVPLVVRKRCSNGLILESRSRIGLENTDYRTIPMMRCWNVEYDLPDKSKLTKDEFIRKSKLRLQQARERMAAEEDSGFLSSSENELDERQDERQAFSLSEEDQDQPSKDDDHLQVMVGDLPQNKEPEEDIEPHVMLDKAMAGMTVHDKGPVNQAVPPIFKDNSMSFLEINRFADELGCLSDATLFEDSFSMLNIPFVSGAVEGFGPDMVDLSTTADPSADKLCKGKNKKP